MSSARPEARKIEHGWLRTGLMALIIHPFDGGGRPPWDSRSREPSCLGVDTSW